LVFLLAHSAGLILLDLVFSDGKIVNIRKSLSLTPIFDPYHPHPLEFIYSLTSTPAITLVKSLTPIMCNFNSYNFDEMYTFLLEIDFIHNFNNLNLEVVISKFNES